MAVYNCEEYLAEAIGSILNHTFTDFEFLIIDDGSSDRSAEIVRSFNDARIRLVLNNENLGLTKCLNKGLQMARGEYIARMDADDISLPQRLKKQIQYLNANSETCVVGSWWRGVNEDGVGQGCARLPVQEHECSLMIYGWGEQPIGHPCVMYRTEVIRQLGGYGSEYPVAQDADLWFRVISSGYNIANIPEILFLYRTHDGQVSSKRRQMQDECHNMALARFLSKELERVVRPEEAALIRPINFDNLHFYEYVQIDKMIRLKQQALCVFLGQYNLSPLEISRCSIVLWESLLPLSKLRILRPLEGLLINTRFCVGFLRNQSNKILVFRGLSIIYFFVGIHTILMKRVLKRCRKYASLKRVNS